MHRLLQRQIKRLFDQVEPEQLIELLGRLHALVSQHTQDPQLLAITAALPKFLQRVSSTYETHEREEELHTRSLQLSSEELHSANLRLQRDAAVKGEVIATLRQTANELLRASGRAQLAEEEDNLADVAALMSRLVHEHDVIHQKLQAASTNLKLQQFALDQHAIVNITDVQGRIIYANQNFCRISQYSEEELLGKDNRIINSGLHEPAFFRDMWQTIAKGQVWHGEIRNRAKDGSFYWVAATIVPFPDTHGKPFQYVAIRTDITRQKEMEETLRQTLVLAESANRAKSDFLANMSHEIRTPMNAIIGMSCLALNRAEDPRQKEYLNKIHQAAQSLLRIINDILDFSKIEAGKLELEEVEFDLDELFQNLASMVSLQAHEKGLELIFSLPPELPQRWRGDSLRLNQVLLNLSGNAIKFTNAGEVVVAVAHGGEANNSQQRLIFTVTDSGVGMSQQQLDRLFRPFTQADSTTTRRFGGTGLGLAISRQLVTLMGGEMAVESHPGRGSVFRFSVALTAVEQTSMHVVCPTEPNLARILVVTNSDTHGYVLSRLLQSFRFDWDCVSSLDGAIDRLREPDPRGWRACIWDTTLSATDMVSGVTRLQQAYSTGTLPILLLHNHQQRHPFHAMTASMSGVELLQKPVTASGLCDRLMNLWGYPSALTVRRGPDNLAATPDQLGFDLAGCRVLLVEDNAVNRQVATEFLEMVGVVVVTANNGLEAIERARQGPFGAILMDVQMPEMDGLMATRRLRSELKLTTPIIALTANAMSGDREKCLAVGMNDHVAKPIDPQDLYRVLGRWAGRLTEPEKSHAQVDQCLQSSLLSQWPLPQQLPGINLELGLNRFMGDKALYRRVLANFWRDQSGTAEQLQRLLSQGEIVPAQRLVHTLKGLAGTLGALSLEQAARSLEEELQQQGRPIAATVLQRLTDELTPLLDALAKYFAADETADLSPVALAQQPNWPQLSELLERLDPILQARQARQSRELLEELEQLLLPPTLLEVGNRLMNQIRRYRFKEAQQSLQEMLHQLATQIGKRT
ncbi:MAG: response regulator [Magnetococcales bacterium]|nr:response regulator [Magnetococcales bacterium]